MAKNSNIIGEQVSGVVARINEKNPYYTLGLFLLIVFLLDYFLVMQFQLRTLYHLNPKVSMLSQELRTTQDTISKLQQYQVEVKKLSQKVRLLNSQIRTREQLPLVIDSIMRLAKKTGVRVEQIMPNSTAPESILKNNEGQYFSIPLVVEARAGYHNFGKFLNLLEREEAFLNIGDFTISASSTEAAQHDIKMNLNAIVFEARGQ